MADEEPEGTTAVAWTPSVWPRPRMCERGIIECHTESREWISAADLYSLERPRGFTAHLPLGSIQLHSLSVT